MLELNYLNLVKYSLILGIAVILSKFAYGFYPLNRVVIEVVKTAAKLHVQWNTYSNTLFSWLVSWTFLILLMLGLIAPFVFLIVILLKLSKKDWLPDNDPNLIKLIDGWLNLCLGAFLLVLLARTLETIVDGVTTPINDTLYMLHSFQIFFSVDF